MTLTAGQTEIAAVHQSSPPLAEPLYCRWLWHSITVLCDGTVTCGLDDPFKSRNYGNISDSSLREIFERPAIATRRSDLESGKRCHGCSMFLTQKSRSASDGLIPSAPYPRRIVLEPSIKCNIRCNNETCNIANDSTFHLRTENYMPWPLFCKLMDEVAPHIEELYFYNYGEPFLHPKALDMLAYAKKLNPRITVTTSTNGILLSRAGKAERIVAEGLVDWICFTIAGVNQSTYIRYHKSGSFEKAFEAMRLVLEAKRRYGKTKPFVHWRYLLFNWNDSDDCIEEALRLKRLIGVDDFKFMLTASPIEGRSLRRAPGTPGFDAIREFLSYQDDYNPDPYAESGLYGLESNQELGAFRWSATKARFKLKSFNGGLNLRLARIAADLGPAQVVTLRLPWTEITANLGSGTWSDNLIELPRDFYQAEVPIELEVDRPFVPMRYIGGTDNRSLGVMISMPGVMPAQNPFRNSAAAVSRPAEASR